MDQNNFRTIQSLGRKELINELMENSTVQKDTVINGVGDDAAVLACREGAYSLLSSETFMEGVDFDLTYTPLNHLGYKVASSAISDIYAMKGKPDSLLVNMALPNKLSVDMVKEIYKGIYSCGAEHDFQVVGGDLTASHQILSMSITCQGTVGEEEIVYRRGAQEGDAVCVTGDLGGAIAGLRILLREKEYWQDSQQQQFQPDLEDYEYVVQRQLVPFAQKKFIDTLEELKMLPSSMIDLTQGLVSELSNITDASDTGAMIYQAALPIALETRQVADEMKEDVDKYALYGGEDLEMLFTLKKEQVEQLADTFSNFTVIGKITSEYDAPVMQTGEGELVSFTEDN
ncbi:thiamine-phosphate kinase [Balneolaceae bacterium YR4-1]|uniref:Thiamine-monophosphate kinase n=1 Tax=Halalkalibaculum roseum TaxID=2709311 RepID=A0A6M1SZL6_9BACT|nr:thiamine-phosphate kinase [Halalkalibaculum roseum]NGP75987.1 thiamine-phosphate kinase [Halalkalibaculum roseum]